MLMTEEQARTKWCPHARQVGVTNRDGGMCATANREGPEHYGADNCNCIASGCMAWQWVPKTHYRDTELWSKSKNRKVNSAWSDDADWRPVEHVGEEPPASVGYCGAFGKAEG